MKLTTMPIHMLSTNATTTSGAVMAYKRSMTNTIWAQGNGKGVSEIALQQPHMNKQVMMQDVLREMNVAASQVTCIM